MKAKVCICGKLYTDKCSCRTARDTAESPTIRGYTAKWRKFREQLFRRRVQEGTALCAICGLVFGLESPHADHIIPVQSADDPLFYEESNIQFLHPGCHSIKTSRDTRQGLTRGRR